MKTFKRILCVVLCILTLTSTMVFAGAENDETTEEVTGFTQEDFLRVKGRKIVNQKGETVQLKGVNLGAWLVREDWLNPDHIGVTEEEYKTMPEKDKAVYDKYKGKKYDGEMIYNALTDRFGREQAQELLDMFYDNWITEWDLDNIAGSSPVQNTVAGLASTISIISSMVQLALSAMFVLFITKVSSQQAIGAL